MRIAFVDLVFSWPPNGGADVDLYHVACGLQDAGNEVRVFVVHEDGSYERGRVRPEEMPFPITRIDVTARQLAPAALCPRIRADIEAWKPDVVFVQHGFALKPYVALALSHLRTVGRFYAHELGCARDAYRFKDGHPCPGHLLHTPDACRKCAAESLKQEIISGSPRTWTSDYLSACAYAPGYLGTVRDSLASYQAVIVSNATLRDEVAAFARNVRVVPGGIALQEFDAPPTPQPAVPGQKTILMAGRAEDPCKGLNQLLEAGRALLRQRRDFNIVATHFDHTLSTDWFRAVGWVERRDMLGWYAAADIVAVPSIWEEPFGLVAVEGMAARKPIVASRTGGLAEIVRHEETGLLFEPGDAAALAGCLSQLLDDPEYGTRLGLAGRRVAEAEYQWDRIIERHYLPLLENVIRE